VTGKL